MLMEKCQSMVLFVEKFVSMWSNIRSPVQFELEWKIENAFSFLWDSYTKKIALNET